MPAPLQTKVSVTTSAAKVYETALTAPAPPAVSAKTYVRNPPSAAASIYLGWTDGVTTSNGFALAPGGVVAVDTCELRNLYAVAGSALSLDVINGFEVPDAQVLNPVRGNIITDNQAYAVPVTLLQAPGTGAQLGATAGTPSGALGLTIGTHGTATPKLVGEAASGNSKSNSGRFQFALPAEYVAAGSVKVRVSARVTGLVQVAQTIDCLCYESDQAAGVSADLCATAAQTLTASFASYDFTITATNLVAGDLLDILLTGAANDTGGTANKLVEIGGIQVLCDVKG